MASVVGGSCLDPIGIDGGPFPTPSSVELPLVPRAGTELCSSTTVLSVKSLEDKGKPGSIVTFILPDSDPRFSGHSLAQQQHRGVGIRPGV